MSNFDPFLLEYWSALAAQINVKSEEVVGEAKTTQPLRASLVELQGRVVGDGGASRLRWRMMANRAWMGGRGRRSWSAMATGEGEQGGDGWVMAWTSGGGERSR